MPPIHAVLRGVCGKPYEHTKQLDFWTDGTLTIYYTAHDGSTSTPVHFNRNNCNGNRTVGPVTATCSGNSVLTFKFLMSAKIDGSLITIRNLGKTFKFPIEVICNGITGNSNNI